MHSSPVEAQERLSRAVEIVRTVDFPPPATAYVLDLVASLHGFHAVAFAMCGKPGQTMKSIGAARKRLSEIDHDYTKANVAVAVAITGYMMHDPEAARLTTEEGLGVTEGRGFHSSESILLIIRGWACACLGEPDEGVSDVERGLDLAQTSGSEVLSTQFYVIASQVHRMARNRKRADDLLNQAKTLEAPHSPSADLVDVTFADALIHLEFGDGLPEVEKLFLRAVDYADTFHHDWAGLRISTHLARIAPQTGKLREAHDRLATHHARLNEGLDRAPVREAKAALDELAGILEAETAAS